MVIIYLVLKLLFKYWHCVKIGKKARQFDINEMMAVAKRRAADAAEEKSKANSKKMFNI